ncbi:MAG: FtsQ-type POTRA domain-containing protein [Opitutaceae bacterium]|nr:FtsQ-type POTRA domain-containing protein [Opitutaceae bacterium]
MSSGGRRRLAFSTLKTVGGIAVLLGLLTVGWLVVDSLQQHPQSIAKTADTSPVKEIALTTDGVLDQTWIKQTLALPRTASLMELDLLQLRERLLASGQALTATVSRKFPATLAVAVVERTPVARVMAQLGNAAPREFLVARDGVVYAGAGYPPELVNGLVWLDGVKLVRKGDQFLPVEGMAVAADLLAKARNEAPHLYQTWKVVSLARLESDNEIQVRTDKVEKIIFSVKDDFFRQLARLDVLVDMIPAQGERPLREIDLSIGRTADGRTEVPVTLDLPQPGTGKGAMTRPAVPAPAVSTPAFNPFLHPQKKPSREL